MSWELAREGASWLGVPYREGSSERVVGACHWSLGVCGCEHMASGPISAT